MEWIEHVLRDNPSLAVFLTLGIGFFIGQLKYKSFSLGTVTSVLLVGVVIGQFDRKGNLSMWNACAPKAKYKI